MAAGIRLVDATPLVIVVTDVAAEEYLYLLHLAQSIEPRLIKPPMAIRQTYKYHWYLTNS